MKASSPLFRGTSGESSHSHEHFRTEPVQIPVEDGIVLHGDLALPENTERVVLFAHGSGSSRHSPRNRFVARSIQDAGTGTLLLDLLTREEEEEDFHNARLRFDIDLLAGRLATATEWIAQHASTQYLKIGYFGSSTGGAAALVAAAELGPMIEAVVSRGGRPDLADGALAQVEAPTLLIVGERDDLVVRLNEEALSRLNCTKQLVIVPRATHLFEEPGALARVATLAANWFYEYLKRH